MSAGLFGIGEKKEEKPPPVDRVRSMMQTGLSEREIIRQLKAEGYGFGDIEKAMMTALKQGVTAPPVPAAREEYMPPPPPPPPRPAAPAPAPPPPGPPPPPPRPAPPAYAAPAQPPEWPQPAYPAGMPPMEEEREPVPLELPPLEAPTTEETPEDIMEDILEGLTEEKFEKFTGEVKKIREEFERMRAEIRAAHKKPAAAAEAGLGKEARDQMDDLEARVGGLEKAFRQFLPSLTQNIEELSKIIHEMRGEKKKGSSE